MEQPKQKKSKSAEFLLAEGEEERSLMKGVVNLAFQEEMGGGIHDSTLAAKCQNVELPAAATFRGNEGPQNYFDPSSAEEGDPRRCRMSGVGGRDELELKFMNEDEKNLYEKLSEMLQEEDTSTVIDLPGTVMSAHDVEEAEPSGKWKDQPRAEQLERRTEVIPHYIDQLRKHVQKDMIPVGRPALAQEDHLEKGMTEEKVWARKKRVMSFLRGNSKIRNINKEEEVLQDRLYDAFQRTETRLLNALRQHQAEVIDKYGDIIEETGSTDMLGIGTDLRWEVEWTKTPQPIEVRVLCLRALREKLPKGLYSLTVSLQTDLGGHTLRWSHLQEQRWTGITEPVQHGGQYCDTDLNINQSLYMVFPASCDLLPSSVLMFRLSMLPSDLSHVSCVVSWGVFPVCDCSLNLLNGKFKTPLLRGGPDPSLNQFSKIEQLLSTDLDNWLCNLYFQVKRLPRGSTGVPERSFTLQVPPHPQQSSSQGLPPHRDASTLSSASVPGRTSAPLNRKECQRMSQPATNLYTESGSCQLQSGGELMWGK